MKEVIKRARELKAEGMTIREVKFKLGLEGFRNKRGVPYGFNSVGEWTQNVRDMRVQRKANHPSVLLKNEVLKLKSCGLPPKEIHEIVVDKYKTRLGTSPSYSTVYRYCLGNFSKDYGRFF